MNHYQLITHGQTSGWDASSNDVNGKNLYGMLPVEVAAQAGDVDEFAAIVSHPEFNPSARGRICSPRLGGSATVTATLASDA